MKRAIVVAVLLAAGCDSPNAPDIERPAFPEVSESYDLTGAVPQCFNAIEVADLSGGIPPRYECKWRNATLDGLFYGRVVIAWERQDSAWVEVDRELSPPSWATSPVAED